MSFKITDKVNKVQNKSIFDYYTDDSMYINKNNCNLFTPSFFTQTPAGINQQHIDTENDLKGVNKKNSKCSDEKYTTSDPNLPQRVDSNRLYNLNECKPFNF